jgi:formate/nitrite transporter FocA (FNT family)
MDYNKASDVVATMVDTAQKKLRLEPRDLLIRGALSGALLGAATTLAFSGAGSTGQPLVGALIFPVRPSARGRSVSHWHWFFASCSCPCWCG